MSSSGEQQHQQWWDTLRADACGPTLHLELGDTRPRVAWCTERQQHWAYTARTSFAAYHSNACLTDPTPPKGKGGRADFDHTHVLWADIDFGHTHTSTHTLADLDECLEVVGLLKLDPTITVHTGAGIHTYWKVDGTYPAGLAEDAMHTIQAALRHIADGRGVDHTWNIDRVLRTPGAHRTVAGEARHVDIIDDGPTWTVDHIEQVTERWRAKQRVPRHSERPVASSVGVAAPDIERGAAVLDALCNPEVGGEQLVVAGLWQRGDLNSLGADRTPSAATLSIARRVHRHTSVYGEPDGTQLAIDAAAAWRHKWAAGTKIERQDYWQRIGGLLAAKL